MSDMVSPQVMMRRRPPSATPSTSGTTGATTTAATATTITPSPQHPPPLAFRTNVFDGLYRESAEKRAHGLEQATSIVRTWAHHWLEVRDASTSTSALALYSSTTSAVLDEQSVETTAVTTAAVTTTVTAEGTAETTPITPAHRETHNLLQAHILVILRMSINCPYTDVRQRFTDFLAELRAMGISVPRPRLLPYTPSFFIHPERVARLDDLDSVDGNKKKNGREDGNSASEETRRILSNVFVANGRFSNIARLMMYFPNYLEKAMVSHNKVMRHQGPLPKEVRNYVAIMASAQHRCQYLVSLQTREFLLNGGDPAWLAGLAHAPQKLQNLAVVNTILAHQPWLLTPVHIEALVRGSDNWSMSELVQALVVLATFHSILPEIDMVGGTVDGEQEDETLLSAAATLPPIDPENDTSNADLLTQNVQLLSRLKQRPETAEEENISTQGTAGNNADRAGGSGTANGSGDRASAGNSPGSNREVFETCEQQETFTEGPGAAAMAAFAEGRRVATAPVSSSGTTGQPAPTPPTTSVKSEGAVIPPSTQSSSSFAAGASATATTTSSSPLDLPFEPPTNLIYEDLTRFLGPPQTELHHVDFLFSSSAPYSVFRLGDYSWEEHGCALVSRFLPETGELLDEEFSAILNLTDYSLFNTRGGGEQVDTWPFRQAIWYYVLRLAGMSHDDYNYHEVNIYLNKRIKQYIKKVACYPEDITAGDFHRMGFQFRPDEKCQINLLAATARKSAELLYALHAVMRYTR